MTDKATIDTDAIDEQIAGVVKAAIERERAYIAIWMREQNAKTECGPFALNNLSHAVEDGSYLYKLASK